MIRFLISDKKEYRRGLHLFEYVNINSIIYEVFLFLLIVTDYSCSQHFYTTVEPNQPLVNALNLMILSLEKNGNSKTFWNKVIFETVNKESHTNRAIWNLININ